MVYPSQKPFKTISKLAVCVILSDKMKDSTPTLESVILRKKTVGSKSCIDRNLERKKSIYGQMNNLTNVKIGLPCILFAIRVFPACTGKRVNTFFAHGKH